MQLILSSYFVPATGLLFLIALILINPLFSKKQSTYLLAAAVINLLLILATSCDYLFAETRNTWDSAWLFRRFTSFLNFATGPLIPVLLLKIFDQNKKHFFIYLPFIINAVLCFASMFSNLVFYITTENKYDRGPLFFIPITTTLFYLGLLLLRPTVRLLQSKKNERKFLFAVIAMMLVSVFLEVAFGLNFANYSCSALGLIMYYLLLNIHGYIIDPLTGVYNRLTYNKTLAGIAGSSRCIIALIDINDFKAVNDTWGHDAGDRFLIRFTSLLNDYMEKTSTLYRIGGDEFVLIAKKGELASFCQALETAHAAFYADAMPFSYGVAEYSPKDNIEDTLKLVDTRMYEHKKQMKASRTENDGILSTST